MFQSNTLSIDYRVLIQNSNDQSIGAFSGWRVLLCVDKLRQPGFKRLLEAGGAQVVGSRPPFNNIDNVSHAFIGECLSF
jgi:hypothetical protein